MVCGTKAVIVMNTQTNNRTTRPGKWIRILCVILALAPALPFAAQGQEKAPPAKKPAETKAAATPKPAATKKKKKKPAPPKIPIEQEPYKVLVNITVASNPRFSLAERQEIGTQVAQLVDRTWGAMWQAETRVNDWICIEETIDSLEPDMVSEKVGRKYDKVMFVSFEPSDLSLAVREWDYRSNTLSIPAKEKVHSARAVPNRIIRLIAEVFQPVLTWRRTDKFDKSYVEVTMKAGKFPAPDPIAKQVRAGDVLTPYIRSFDKRERDKVVRIQDQLLTYLIVQNINEEIVGGTVISGVPSMFGKNTRRAEQFALRRRPRFKSTKLQLVLRTRPDKPLLCHRVNVVSKLKYRDEELAPSTNFISDRYGKVDVPTGKYPTYWVYVYSGKLLLARVPYAPGLFAEQTVLMPDDSMRLLVEGEVDLLKGRLISRVARGAVHMSAAMAYAKEGKADAVRNEVALLEELPGKQSFEDQIIAFERPAINRAERANNRVSRGRIKRVVGEIRNVLNNFFNEEKLKQFKAQLEGVFVEPDDDDEP